MILIIGFIGGAILKILSILHFHWALGGSYGFDKSLPTNEKGERVLNPKRLDSAVVGIGLLKFAFVFMIKSNLIQILLPSIIMDYALWLIVIIFLLRAIGDFKYVGFFKKIRNTEFSKMDSKFYAPVCLLLSALGLIIELKA